MDTWDAIRARRNVRSFTGEALPEEALERIMEAARRTPSGSNRQLWAFVLCTDPDAITGLSETWQGASWVGAAPAAVALLCPKDPDDDGGANPRRREVMQYDLGQATMSIMLAAADLGIGSGQAGVLDQARAQEVLGFPDDWYCAWVVALGHPADRPLRPVERPNRKPIDEVVHRDRW
jgi:nitroreductase